MTKVSLSRDTVLYSIMFWGQKLTALIVLPFAISHFTTSDFGYYSIVQITASFLFVLGMLAVADQGLPRFFIETEDESQKKAYVTATFIISFIGNILFLILFILFFLIYPNNFRDIGSPKIFTGITAILFLTQSFFYLGNSLLRWTFKTNLVLMLNLSKTVASSALIIFGIFFWSWKAEESLLTLAISNLIGGIWANHKIRHLLDFKSPCLEHIRKLLKFSWPLWGLNIFAFLSLYANNFLLAKLTTLGDLGIYALAVFAASLFETLTGGFFFATGPYILTTYKEDWAPAKLAQYFSVVSAIGVASIIVLGLWAPLIIKLFKGDNSYEKLGVIIPWVLSGTIFYYLGAYFSPGPYITHKTHWNFITFFVSVVLNVVLSIILIPLYGVLGAGFSIAIANCCSGIFLLYLSQRLYYVPLHPIKAFSSIIITAAIISIIQGMIFQNNPDGVVKLMVISATTMFLLTATTLYYYNDVKNISTIRKIT